MNKKLFTLAAGLLLGTAFTVNAQTTALKKGAEVDGNTYYYLASGGKYLTANADAVVVASTGNKYATIKTSGVASNVGDLALWKVILSNEDGQPKVKLYNKGAQAYLALNANGTAVTDAGEPVVKAMILTNGSDPLNDANKNGVWELGTRAETAAVITIRTSAASGDAKYLKFNDAAWNLTGNEASEINIYAVDPEDGLDSEYLNGLMGGSFTFNFPDADPAPASNIFGQKLVAVEVPGAATADVLDSQDAKATGYNGLYFVTSAPDGAVVKKNNKYYFADLANFKKCKFVAVDPVERYDINGFSRIAGAGFKFQTIDGDEMVVDPSKKGETALANAKFSVSIPDPVNDGNSYLIQVSPEVAKVDAESVPDGVDDPVYAMAYTTLGSTYVMTYNARTLKNATFAAKLVSSKVIGAADLLKKDAPSVFNIMFTSNKDKLTNDAGNSSEYGKYLAVSSNATNEAYRLLAQGPAYLDLDAPEAQWVVTGFEGNYFTLTNREHMNETLTLQLSKTDDKNVYDVFSKETETFGYAYVDAKGTYKIEEGKDLHNAGFQVKLVPTTITPNAGYADLTEEEIADPIVMKFTTSNPLFVKNLYVKVTKTGENYGLATTDDIDEADEWVITKFAAKTDSISSKIKYAYMKGNDVATSDEIANTGITTYALKWKNDNVKAYFNGAGTLTLTDKVARAKRQIIKVTKDGALLVFGAGLTDNKYSTEITFEENALSIDDQGAVVAGQNIYKYGNMKAVLSFESVAAVSESLEAEPRHASFKSVNGGFLGMDENNNAIIAATQEEAKTLTFWLDTTDVKETTTNFYISQAMPEGLKAAEPRMFLFNPTDSTKYYDEGTASETVDLSYYLDNEANVKAMFKQATLINKDSINTIIKGEEVGLNKDNGLNRFKFQIVLADDEEEVYAIKSGNAYLSSINGKIGFGTAANALIVSLGEGDATANEAIEAAGVQVIGGQGAVTVQGAAGKVITVANVLGQTIANQVAASDNVTIAAPAGIVVVAVEGEATKVVVK
ncbi:hypothetical protein JQM84_11380 [Parabacteroides distasonis]|nr:hypothetical protein [Parabacteroides distasonis]